MAHINETDQPDGGKPGDDDPLAMLKAKLAAEGHHVRDAANRGYLAIHKTGHMTRYCMDDASLRNFARNVGVA